MTELDQSKGFRMDTGKPDVLAFLHEIFTKTKKGKEFIKQLREFKENEKPKFTTEEYNNLSLTGEVPHIDYNGTTDNCFFKQIYPAIEPGLRQLALGAAKGYPRGNWTLGMDYSKVVNSQLRHLFTYIFCGMETDRETGGPELNGALINALILAAYEATGKGNNNLGEYGA